MYVLMLLPGLRGAAALKQRTADLRGISTSSSDAMAMSVSAGIHKGTTLAVCLPCGERHACILYAIYTYMCRKCDTGACLLGCYIYAGRVRVRTVSVFPRRGDGGAAVLRLGKKRLRGAFATFNDCK
jgi:hypothetical protein